MFIFLKIILNFLGIYGSCLHRTQVVDKILLRKRSLIETVNDQLKNISQIEHSRHRSIWNFFVNLFAGLIAYTYLPQKPSLDLAPKGLPALPAALF